MQPSMKNDVSNRQVSILIHQHTDIDATESQYFGQNRRWWQPLPVCTQSISDVYSDLFNKRSKTTLILLTAIHSTVGLTLIHSFYHSTVNVQIDFQFLGGWPYAIQSLSDKIIIAQQQNVIPRKHHTFIALSTVTQQPHIQALERRRAQVCYTSSPGVQQCQNF